MSDAQRKPLMDAAESENVFGKVLRNWKKAGKCTHQW